VASEPILVVDDNAMNVKLMVYLLSGEGYDLRTASDAGEALAILKDFRPLVILMDLQMPGMSGLELARQLKTDPATRDIAIIAVTSYAMKGDEAKAVEAGCDAYITKPIDAKRLLATVAHHAGRI
jgi:CheY-like chemotaxis protein